MTVTTLSEFGSSEGEAAISEIKLERANDTMRRFNMGSGLK